MGGEFHSGLSVFVSVYSGVCVIVCSWMIESTQMCGGGIVVSCVIISVLCSAATGCHPVQVQPTVVVTKTERLITQSEINLFSCYVSISERC